VLIPVQPHSLLTPTQVNVKDVLDVKHVETQLLNVFLVLLDYSYQMLNVLLVALTELLPIQSIKLVPLAPQLVLNAETLQQDNVLNALQISSYSIIPVFSLAPLAPMLNPHPLDLALNVPLIVSPVFLPLIVPNVLKDLFNLEIHALLVTLLALLALQLPLIVPLAQQENS
jgi:hypothetical protein